MVYAFTKCDGKNKTLFGGKGANLCQFREQELAAQPIGVHYCRPTSYCPVNPSEILA